MSKKKKKKETLLAETVEMQKKQAMNLVAQSTVNQQLLKEVIGIKEEMDATARKTNHKFNELETLIEEVNKKVHIDDGEASKIKSVFSSTLQRVIRLHLEKLLIRCHPYLQMKPLRFGLIIWKLS